MSGRRAVVALVVGTLLLFSAMMVSLWPSLRPYRRAGADGTASSRGAGGGASSPDLTGASGRAGARDSGGTQAPGGVSSPGATPDDGRALPPLALSQAPDTVSAINTVSAIKTVSAIDGTLVSSLDPEVGGRIFIEPAPIPPAETLPMAPPSEPAPEPPPAEPTPAAGATEAGEGGGGAGGDEGGGTPPVLEAPVVLRAAWLSYPEEARKRRVEGSAEVRIRVSESGGVLEVALATSAGDTALDRAALDAARTLRFRPARLGRVPVAVWYNYRFAFSLPR